MIKDRRFAIVFRSAAFLITLFGLLMHMGILDGSFTLSPLAYYTIQSNILALFLFGLLLVKTILCYRQDGTYGKTGFFPRFEMICAVDLLLTFFVYWLLLAPGAFSMGGDYSLFSFDNLSVHLFTPLLCFADYILFAEPHHLKYRDIYGILIFPLGYVAATSAAGFMGYVFRISEDGQPVHFPYFFYDYYQVGATAFLYIAALVVFFVGLAHLLYLLDRKWNKPVLIPRQKSYKVN